MFTGGELTTAQGEDYFDKRYTMLQTNGMGMQLPDQKTEDLEGANTLIGLVNIDSDPNADTYQKWLKDNYGLVFDKFDHSEVVVPTSP